jgi:hypothetical protein
VYTLKCKEEGEDSRKQESTVGKELKKIKVVPVLN